VASINHEDLRYVIS